MRQLEMVLPASRPTAADEDDDDDDDDVFGLDKPPRDR